jgi:hypothetical protein
MRRLLVAFVVMVASAAPQASAAAEGDPGPAAPPPPATTPATQQASASPPRPPLDLAPSSTQPPPWVDHLELGAAGTWLARASAAASPARLAASPAIEVWAAWKLFGVAQARARVTYLTQTWTTPPGSLVRDFALPRDEALSATGYSLGADITPYLQLSSRVRLLGSVGITYARLQTNKHMLVGPGVTAAMYPRELTFFELPIGLGVSIDLVDRGAGRDGWLALVARTTVAPSFAVDGTTVSSSQVVDSEGRAHPTERLPSPEVTFGQSVGLALRF